MRYLHIFQEKAKKKKPALITPVLFISIFYFFHRRNIAVFGSLGATLLSLGLFLYLSHLQTSEASQLGRNAPGQAIANSRLIRLAIFLISNTLIATCAVFSVVNIRCTIFPATQPNID